MERRCCWLGQELDQSGVVSEGGTRRPVSLRAGKSDSWAELLPGEKRRAAHGKGRSVVVFDGPQGHGFYKGGHDGQTANTMVCIDATQRCVVILSNDVRSEAGFAELVRFILGETGVPYEWEYGTFAAKSRVRNDGSWAHNCSPVCSPQRSPSTTFLTVWPAGSASRNSRIVLLNTGCLESGAISASGSKTNRRWCILG